MRQTTLHKELEEYDRERELDRAPHNENTGVCGVSVLHKCDFLFQQLQFL